MNFSAKLESSLSLVSFKSWNQAFQHGFNRAVSLALTHLVRRPAGSSPARPPPYRRVIENKHLNRDRSMTLSCLLSVCLLIHARSIGSSEHKSLRACDQHPVLPSARR